MKTTHPVSGLPLATLRRAPRGGFPVALALVAVVGAAPPALGDGHLEVMSGVATFVVLDDAPTQITAIELVGQRFFIAGQPFTVGPGCTLFPGSTTVATCIGFTSLHVETGAGDDLVQALLAVPATIDGGAGDDTLRGGPGADDIHGGDGDDVVDYSGQTALPLSVTFDDVANDGGPGEGDNVHGDVETVSSDPGAFGLEVRDGELRWTDHLGAANWLGIAQESTQVVVIDWNGNPMTLGPGCTYYPGLTFLAACTAPVTRIRVDGGGGNDSIANATSLPAVLNGGPGNDNITGGSGPDRIDGGDGTDAMNGADGDDELVGGSGLVADGGDQIHGGNGSDVADYHDHETGPLSISFDGVANDGGPGEADNVFADIEAVRENPNFPHDQAIFDPDGDGSFATSLPVSNDVWAGMRMALGLFTQGGTQVVGFYENATGFMRFSARRLGTSVWYSALAPVTAYPWPIDDHRSIELAIDSQGYLHAAGNMHDQTMQYFRTTEPIAQDPSKISTITRQPVIVPTAQWQWQYKHPQSNLTAPMFESAAPHYERNITYPVFAHDAAGNLILSYRFGGSTAGETWFARWDPATQTWSRVIDKPVTSFNPAIEQLNAYHHTMLHDGVWHAYFAFRPSGPGRGKYVAYAVTPDWLSWATAAGTPLALPLRQSSGEPVLGPPNGPKYIDCSALQGGFIVECSDTRGIDDVRLNFDSANRPMLTYTIHDAQGRLGVKIARFENGAWHRAPVTQWQFPLPGGSDPFAVFLSEATETVENGQPYVFVFASQTVDPLDPGGSEGWYKLDATTLAVLEVRPKFPAPTLPPKPCNDGFVAPPTPPLAGMPFDLNNRSGPVESRDYYALGYRAMTAPDPTAPPSTLHVYRSQCMK